MLLLILKCSTWVKVLWNIPVLLQLQSCFCPSQKLSCSSLWTSQWRKVSARSISCVFAQQDLQLPSSSSSFPLQEQRVVCLSHFSSFFLHRSSQRKFLIGVTEAAWKQVRRTHTLFLSAALQLFELRLSAQRPGNSIKDTWVCVCSCARACVCVCLARLWSQEGLFPLLTLSYKHLTSLNLLFTHRHTQSLSPVSQFTGFRICVCVCVCVCVCWLCIHHFTVSKTCTWGWSLSHTHTHTHTHTEFHTFLRCLHSDAPDSCDRFYGHTHSAAGWRTDQNHIMAGSV